MLYIVIFVYDAEKLTTKRYLQAPSFAIMLRPSFRKHFHEDNFNDISDVLENEVADASSVFDSRTNNSKSESSIDGKADIRPKSMLQKPGKPNEGGKDPQWDSDRSVYELQLNQLQEQLVETMVENQQLGIYRLFGVLQTV